MIRKVTVIRVYIKLFILLILSIGLFGCSSTDEVENNRGEYQHNRSLKNTDKSLSSQTSAELLSSAADAEQRGDLDKALFYYIQSLQLAPENVAILLKIAQIHKQLGNNTIAIRAYSEAIKNDPNLFSAYEGLGIISMEMRKYKEAQEYLQKSVLIDQKRLAKQGAKNEVGFYLLDKASPIKSYNVLGIIEDMQRNFDLAQTYYNLALKADENSAQILSNIGYSYYLTGELTKAEHYFRRAINVENKFKRAWSNLALVYMRKGQYTRSIKALKQVMSEFEAYNDLGYFLMLDGRLNDAEYFFTKAINLSPAYFKKAYSNLEQVQIKRRELWLLQHEALGNKVTELQPEIDFDRTRAGMSADLTLEENE